MVFIRSNQKGINARVFVVRPLRHINIYRDSSGTRGEGAGSREINTFPGLSLCPKSPRNSGIFIPLDYFRRVASSSFFFFFFSVPIFYSGIIIIRLLISHPQKKKKKNIHTLFVYTHTCVCICDSVRKNKGVFMRVLYHW